MRSAESFALEGIDHQANSKLAADLLVEVQALRTYSIVSNVRVLESRLAKIINAHTGISIYVTTEPGMVSYVHLPDIQKNHVFANNERLEYGDSRDSRSLMESCDFIVGTVNLRSGRVYGDFCKMNCELCIGDWYLNRDSTYTPEETVAAILHELGHIFIYFEMVGRCTKTNYLLIEGTKRLMTAGSKEMRIRIFNDLEESIGTSIPDKDKLASRELNEDGYQNIILCSSIQESKEQLDLNIYDARSFEQLADNFVSRHGYGRALATGLDKTYRLMGNRAYTAPSVNTFNNILSVLIPIVAVGGSIALGSAILVGASISSSLLYMLTMGNPLASEYDPPKKRILKLKQQINDALKDRSLSTEQKKLFLQDYHTISGLLDNMYENCGVFEGIWKTVFNNGRRQSRTLKLQDELEGLLNNDLFTSAVELELINK